MAGVAAWGCWSISSSQSFGPYSRPGPCCMLGIRGGQDQPCTRETPCGTHSRGGGGVMRGQTTRGEAEGIRTVRTEARGGNEGAEDTELLLWGSGQGRLLGGDNELVSEGP